MHVRWLIVLLLLGLSACGEQPVSQKGEKGDPGPPGPAGPEGPLGPVGPSGTFIRFVDGECRQACTLSCQENERILSTYAINPGGSFVFDADNKVTFSAAAAGGFSKSPCLCSEGMNQPTQIRTPAIKISITHKTTRYPSANCARRSTFSA
jgi:hypothetical protein